MRLWRCAGHPSVPVEVAWDPERGYLACLCQPAADASSQTVSSTAAGAAPAEQMAILWDVHSGKPSFTLTSLGFGATATRLYLRTLHCLCLSTCTRDLLLSSPSYIPWHAGSQDRVQTGPGAVHVLRNLAPAASEHQPYACFRQRAQETRQLSAAIVDVDVHHLLTGVSPRHSCCC